MAMLKPNDVTWFRPLWRRIAVTVFLAVWCIWEWLNGDMFWSLLVTAALAYSLYNFFYAFPKEEEASQPPLPNEPPEE